MSPQDLFDFDYSLDLPDQNKFPLNLPKKGLMVREILLNDLNFSENYLIVTGFTSLSSLISILGSTDYKGLKKIRVVIGFDPDERVAKKLPHYSLPVEIKNYWIKQDISIKLCGPILNIIEKIKQGKFEFRLRDKLHAKIYVGDNALILGSSNFSKSGLIFQTEANIRVNTSTNDVETKQYKDGRQIAEYYYGLASDYNKDLIELLNKLLKDATWQEALARAIAEIVESKWMKDYPALYQALVTHNLWPSQRIAIARAMKIIQDQGRVLIADPTGSGKTKFATALAYTLFHWLWENGRKDRSNALIICPKQVMDNWEREQVHYNLYNKIESMGKLSLGHDKSQKALQKQIEQSDILVIDEAHNYLHPGSKRSQAIAPKGSTHVVLTTATPINKKADDLTKKTVKPSTREQVARLQKLFITETDGEEYVDFSHFADLWLAILIPALDEMKSARRRKRKILTLKDLKLKNVKSFESKLESLLLNCQYSSTLDEMISACIIGVTKDARI
jgi:PLD-like domain/Type III restriction enzyme, res subunit